MTDFRSQPSNVDALRKQAFDLSCNDQYRLATFIAENVGYWLAPELDHPDSPHQSMTSPSQPTSPPVDTDPKCCPACKSDLRYHSPETYSEYEGWEFECNAIIIRNENGRLEVETDCSNATRNALSAPRVEPVAFTNEAQLGFLKDPACAEIPMAMWGKKSATSNVPLYASPPSQPDGEMLQRCVDMLADVPGNTLEDKLTKYIGEYMSLQLRSAQPDTGVREAAWLVEWPEDDNVPVRWWHCKDGWMRDANKATWFGRKSDAESLIVSGHWGRDVVATEHKFLAALPPDAGEKK